MGFKPVSIVALVFVVIAFLFSVIALASPYWQTGSGEAHNGLWKVCSFYGTCGKYTEVNSWVNWTRFFMFAEMFLLLAAAIMVGLAFAKETKVLGMIAVICMLLGGGCGMVAMALYTDKRSALGNWGWAYGMGWAAWLFAWIAAGLSAKSTTDL